MKRLLEEILQPSTEFTPIPFWFFNDEPNQERIEAQLTDYVEKGVNGIVLHPRIGVPENIPYLSKEYFETVRFIVKTAEKLQMKVVLYDEGMYPSGSAHGMVVAGHPEYASKGIRIFKENEELPTEGRLITGFADGTKLIYCYTHGTIRGIHFGEDDGEAGAPASADILNPNAVDEFIRLTHERYYQELKEYFGSTVIAFFTDEPSALGRNAASYREWVDGMEGELLAAGGKLEELQDLFVGKENETTILYHKLIKKKLREIFYARLSKWCEEHHISLIGHPEVSDDVEEELYFHIPGQDLIMRRVSPESGGLLEFDSVQAKLAADIARHLGRRRNANECFGVCFRNQIPWYFTGADMKWYIDWLGVRGVNLYIPHAFYYSVAGKRKEERPPDVGPNNIWWKHYRRVSDYMKRLSYLMTDSVNGAKVAVLCDNNKVPYQEIACLYENQIEFNYLPVALLPECEKRDGKLCIQGYEYEKVLHVGEGIASLDATWQRELAEAGITIVSEAKELLPDMGLRAVCLSQAEKNLRAVRLSKGNHNMYLFSNEGENAIHTQVICPEKGAIIFVDLWKGICYEEQPSEEGKTQEYTSFALNLQPRETLLAVVAKPDAEGAYTGIQELAVRYKALQSEVFLGDWSSRFTLIEKQNNTAKYVLSYQTKVVEAGAYFTVNGEEMAECYCNGRFVDVSLWGTHKFEIGSFLREGDNEIEVIFTGSAANVYCDAEIPFGIESRA